MIGCGNKVHRDFAAELIGVTHHHETIAQVKLCFAREGGLRSLEEEALLEQWNDEMRAEIEAEQAVERYYEDRGWAEALAQDEYEARMGVIPFDVAMRLAEGN